MTTPAAPELWMTLRWLKTDAAAAFAESGMTDSSLAQDVRSTAGSVVFRGLEGQDRRERFFRHFEERNLPDDTAWGLVIGLLQEDGIRTLRETARRVLDRPELAQEYAFRQMATSASSYVPLAVRTEIATSLERALVVPTSTSDMRERISGISYQLRYPVR